MVLKSYKISERHIKLLSVIVILSEHNPYDSEIMVSHVVHKGNLSLRFVQLANQTVLRKLYVN